MDSWKFREEILRTVNQWYLVLGFIVLGGLAAYLLSFLVPAPYRAVAELYVGIDVVRVNEMEYLIPLAKEEPLNLDDYKNWQLKQVADTLRLDDVLEDTLTALAGKDSYWKEISLTEFKQSIDIYWYDTGIWQLEIINQDRSRAEMAAQSWLDTGYARIKNLLVTSQRVALLDSELQLLKDAGSDYKQKIVRLEAFLESSDQWIETLTGLDQIQPLPEELQLELQSWIAFYGDDEALWQISLGDYPGEGKNATSYSVWIEDARIDANVVLEETKKASQILLAERESILPDYHQALDDSLGLSANLVLQANTSQPVVTQVRSTGTTTLLGSFLGLMAWLIYAVLRVRGQRNDQD